MARRVTRPALLAAMHNYLVRVQQASTEELAGLFNLKVTSVPVYVSTIRKMYNMEIEGRKGIFTLFSDHSHLPLGDDWQSTAENENAEVEAEVEEVEEDEEEAVA